MIAADRERDAAQLAARFAASASVELTPGDVNAHLELLPGALRPGTPILLTALVNRAPDDQLVAAQKVRDAGFEPVPHIAARGHRGARELGRHLGRLVSSAAVRDVLVVAGGQARPLGPLTSSLDVLRSGTLEAAGIRRVRVAGYPEGISGISPAALTTALAEKNELAADRGWDMRVLTQFAFAARAYLDWESAAREAGNRLPVTVGLAGVVSRAKLLRFAVNCGVGPSASILRKQTRGVLRLASARAWRPDDVLAGICEGVARDPDCLIDGLHLFTFGSVVATADWLKAPAREA